ncbi:hypothetical protein TNCV_620561 [Trichonephila clavipes]|nr:hypothetical protein TNCV_620561 [Trichonephila clavipes]
MERNATEGRSIPVMGVQQETSGLYANRSSRIVTGEVRYELPSVCLENLIHARWDSGDRAGNPYVQYPHSLRSCSAATVR